MDSHNVNLTNFAQCIGPFKATPADATILAAIARSIAIIRSDEKRMNDWMEIVDDKMSSQSIKNVANALLANVIPHAEIEKNLYKYMENYIKHLEDRRRQRKAR